MWKLLLSLYKYMEERIVKDSKQRTPAGKFFTTDKNNRMIIDQKQGVIRWVDENGEKLGEFGIIDENKLGFTVFDDNLKNKFFVGRDDNFYGYKLAKPNKDVFADERKDLLLSSEVSFIEIIAGSPSGSENGSLNSTDTVGWVSYIFDSNLGRNNVVRLDFFKPDDIVVVSAEIKVLHSSGVAYYSGSNVESFLSNASLYLNPQVQIVTHTPTAGAESQLKRYSNNVFDGLELFTEFDFTSDQEEKVVNLTTGQIGKLKNGWNTLVVQQEVSNANLDEYGFITINIILSGYKVH